MPRARAGLHRPWMADCPHLKGVGAWGGLAVTQGAWGRRRGRTRAQLGWRRAPAWRACTCLPATKRPREHPPRPSDAVSSFLI